MSRKKVQVSKGSLYKDENGWNFDIRVNGKRIRRFGRPSKKVAQEEMERVRAGKSVSKKHGGGVAPFWDAKRLEHMKTEILPKVRTLDVAMLAAVDKWGHTTSISRFRFAFKKRYGKGPGVFLSKTSTDFWTTKRLLAMRDVILPKAQTIQDALEDAAKKWTKGRGLNMAYFQKAFLEHFDRDPKIFVGLEVGSLESVYIDLPPERNPLYLFQIVKEQKNQLRKVRKQLFKAKQLKEMIKYELRGAVNVPMDPAKWVVNPPIGKYLHGVPFLFLSDLHYSEVVKPEQVEGVNAFNIPEANRRLKRFFSKTISLIDYSFASADYPGIVVMLGGDMISGLIHEELRATNEVPIFPAIILLVEQLVAGINLLKERFKKVFVPIVVGNHGRIDKKMRTKDGPSDNYEYMMGQLLASKYDKDDDVDVVVSDGFEYFFPMYDTKILLQHGDGFKGGSGIQGPVLPWILGDYRKRKQRQSMEAWTEQEYLHDIMCFGHWHSTFPTDGFLANGSGKGFDEWAKKRGFSYEPPKQLFWMLNPQYGVIHVNSIYGVPKPVKPVKTPSIFEK